MASNQIEQQMMSKSRIERKYSIYGYLYRLNSNTVHIGASEKPCSCPICVPGLNVDPSPLTKLHTSVSHFVLQHLALYSGTLTA